MTMQEKKMDKKIKQKWLRALRSKRFEQGEGQLCADYGEDGKQHCCLGVLCEVMDVKFNGEAEYPSRTRLREAGLTMDTAKHLADLNDSGHSFSEIADEIRDNL